MRFIVDFYRYILFGLIGLSIIGLVYATLEFAVRDGWTRDASPYVFAIGAAAIALFVMSLGITATFISIHDRHVELVAELRELREHITSTREADAE